MVQPVDIEHDRGARRLTITWDDGRRSRLGMDYLRAWCPCAACQGHGNEVHFRPAGEGREATGIEEVGAYAIAIHFDDGHQSGIYRWSWLRDISAESEPAGLKYGAFIGGVYRPSPRDRGG